MSKQFTYQWDGKFTGDSAYCINCKQEYGKHKRRKDSYKLFCRELEAEE